MCVCVCLFASLLSVQFPGKNETDRNAHHLLFRRKKKRIKESKKKKKKEWREKVGGRGGYRNCFLGGSWPAESVRIFGWAHRAILFFYLNAPWDRKKERDLLLFGGTFWGPLMTSATVWWLSIDGPSAVMSSRLFFFLSLSPPYTLSPFYTQ